MADETPLVPLPKKPQTPSTDTATYTDLFRVFNVIRWLLDNRGNAGIPDAPDDGGMYARQDGTWELVTPEAPLDNKIYGRKDGDWVEITGGGGGASVTEVEVLARDMSPSASGGASAFAITATTSGRPDIQAIAFDPSTAQSAQFSVTLPAALVASDALNFEIRWSHPTASAPFNVVWGLKAVGINNGQTIAVDYGTAKEVIDTGGVANYLYITTITGPLQVAGTLAEGVPVFFNVYRKAADSSDTLAVAARLHSVRLTTDQPPPPPVGATTWNPLDKAAGLTLSNGDLTASGNVNTAVRSVFGASSGKWYWEVTITARYDYAMVGVGLATATLSRYPGFDAFGWSLYGYAGGKKVHNAVQTSYGATLNVGNVVGVLLNMDDGELSFNVNGVSYGVAFTGLSGTMYAMFGGASSGPAETVTANFGATPFVYTVPTGYKAGFGLGL